MKIYDKKIGKKKVKVFTQQFIQLGDGPQAITFDYRDFIFKNSKVFNTALRLANQLNSHRGKLNCFIVTHEMQFPRLAKQGKPFHAALVSKERIDFDKLRKNFIR